MSYLPRIQSTDPGVEVRRGRVAGLTSHQVTAIERNIDTTASGVRVVGARGTAPQDFDFPVAATVMGVSSSSVNDASAGTGARTVRLVGLDAALATVTEDVTLNGQTQVTTSTSFLRVTRMIVLTVGSGGHNDGIVYAYEDGATVTTGVPQSGMVCAVFGSADAGDNISHVGTYTVPAGSVMLWTTINLVTTASASLPITVFTESRSSASALWVTGGLLSTTAPIGAFTLPSTATFAAGTDIRLRIEATGGQDVSLFVHAVLDTV